MAGGYQTRGLCRTAFDRASTRFYNGLCVAYGDVYLWVADPRQVTFLWTDKEKSPKEIRPGARAPFLRSSPHRALANSSAANNAARLKQGLA